MGLFRSGRVDDTLTRTELTDLIGEAVARVDPRELAEIEAMKDLHDARRALERATDLTARARQALQDATSRCELARREVRRISELGRVR